MADETYGFDDDDSTRIANAVRRVESMRPAEDKPDAVDPQNTQPVKITGAAVASDDGTDDLYYPGIVVVWDVETEAWVSIIDHDGATDADRRVYAINVSGGTLATDGRYAGKQVGEIKIDGVYQPLFIILGSEGPCPTPDDPPEGWTATAPACYVDFVEQHCESGALEYRRIRLFMSTGGFVTWTGPWGSTYPPATP